SGLLSSTRISLSSLQADKRKVERNKAVKNNRKIILFIIIVLKNNAVNDDFDCFDMRNKVD
ncbi:MAG: hypothetical protein AAF564_26650, partial [Bacteroidota bacterium]